jgi:hypothetical protein
MHGAGGDADTVLICNGYVYGCESPDRLAGELVMDGPTCEGECPWLHVATRIVAAVTTASSIGLR